MNFHGKYIWLMPDHVSLSLRTSRH